MKRLTLFSLLIFTVFAMSSCKKDKNPHTSVKGQVLDATTSTLIKGASVFLEARGDCFSCGKQTIASTVSDANGNFSFDFTASEGNIYSLAASKDRYYNNTGNYGPSTTLTTGEENKKNVVLQPEAYLKIHIKNTQPYDDNDLITVSGDWNCCKAPDFYGKNIDTDIRDYSGNSILKVYGNTSSNLYWFVTKNKVYTKYTANVYCPAFDTTSYSINY